MLKGEYKKIIVLLLLIIGGSFFIVKKMEDIESGAKKALRLANITTVCDETIYYSLGSIDPGFKISKEEVLVILKKAEDVWERELGKNVFEYREGSEFKVNFIFDERQTRTNEKSRLDEQLNVLEYDKNNLSLEYQQKFNSYNKALKIYESNLKDYSDRVEKFNKKVKNLEKDGEITKEEYENLKEDEQDLSETKDDLDKERDNLTLLIEQVNSVVNRENSLVNKYNDKIKTYRDNFGEAVEFNQGEYDGTSINIYQFHDDKDLELVISHELGHALGIGHVENSQSVMYYLMEDQDLENIKLTAEDLDAIGQICRIK